MEQIAQKIGMSRNLNSGSSFDPEQYCKRKCERYNRQEGALNLEDGYNCPKCKNKGFIAIAEKTKFGFWSQTMQPCECQAVRASLKRLKRSGLEKVLQEKNFENYKINTAWRADMKNKAVAFANDESSIWLFMGGNSGAGKTHLCTAVCGKMLEQGREVRYMMWRDDVDFLKRNKLDDDIYGKMLDDFKKVDVLYIDDLFKTGDDNKGARPTSADINIAFEIINYRYNNRLKTIISCEWIISGLVEIDEAIAGRINEMAGKYCINIKKDPKKNYRLYPNN